MKNLYLSLAFLLVTISLTAQNDIQSYFGFSTFNTPSETPYTEAYFAVDASSLTFRPSGNDFQAGAEITVLFSQDGEVKNFDKFNLFSKKVEDTATNNFSIMAQRRIALDNGTYDVEVIIKDIHQPKRKSTYPPEELTIEYQPKEIAISDIRLIKDISKEREGSVFNKNGYDLFPYLINYYPTDRSKIYFYAEVYNLDENHLDEDVLITYSMHQPGNKQPISGMMQYAKQKGEAVNVVIGGLRIEDLPSGKYEMQIQVRNRKNKLLAEKRMAIYRSNKRSIGNYENIGMVNINNTFVEELEPEKMEWYLKGLKPICSDVEERAINTVLAENDSTLQRQFMYNFWTKRNMTEPAKPWKQYLEKLKFVRDEFRLMNRYGFETDRGRIYLQYGKPQERFESTFEANSEPYEIWRYNRTDIGETNVFFVFKSVDLISNDFQLLHSNATGEIKNENWQSELDGKFPNPGGVDPHDPRGSFGNSNSEIFDRGQ